MRNEAHHKAMRRSKVPVELFVTVRNAKGGYLFELILTVGAFRGGFQLEIGEGRPVAPQVFFDCRRSCCFTECRK